MREKREKNEMRTIEIIPDFTCYAEGSVLISYGNTKVLCNATVDDKVPSFLKDKGDNYGWITAEYNMLPRSTHTRSQRERGKVGGRTQEIQRLIGRSFRSVVDLSRLGARRITVDCDVIQADGGTRTASITGGFVALMIALQKLKEKGELKEIPVNHFLAAVSVGKVDGEFLLDLEYSEDSVAELDMNIVMTDDEKFIEIQGTGEEKPFSDSDLDELLQLSKIGAKAIIKKQKEVLGL